MGLLPDYRGHGLGERLIRTALDTATRAEFERVSLSVYASNTRALPCTERWDSSLKEPACEAARSTARTTTST